SVCLSRSQFPCLLYLIYLSFFVLHFPVSLVHDSSTSELYALSLHDALPISIYLHYLQKNRTISKILSEALCPSCFGYLPHLYSLVLKTSAVLPYCWVYVY